MKYNVQNFISLNILIAVLSGALLCYQIFLIDLLSITQWYHFAYMIISIALLGFGSAGTLLSILKDKMLVHYEELLFILTILTALLISISVTLSQSELFFFDSYKIFSSGSRLFSLLVLYILFILPFLSGSLAIGLTFVKYTNRIGKLYFSNMTGSGLGAIIYLFLSSSFRIENISTAISLSLIIISFLAIKNYKYRKTLIFLMLIVISTFLILFARPTLTYSEYKEFTKVLNLPGSELIIKENSIYGEISLVRSPSMRYAPGLSLVSFHKIPSSNSMFINGNWKGILIESEFEYKDIFRSSTGYLPYAISKRNSVVCIESGTGSSIKQAILQNANEITAVEENRALTDLLINKYSIMVDSIYNDPKVKLHNITSRNFILSSSGQYDLIQLPVIDAFGGTSGISALKTDYLFTKEAFSEMLLLLTDNGVISVSTWIDYPYNNTLKLFSIISEALYERGINDPIKHLVAVKNWNTVTILAKREPFHKSEIDSVKNFCKQFNFDPFILHGIKSYERNYYNKLNDTLFFSYIDKLLSPVSIRNNLYNNYPFNIKYPSDNKPYFSQFMKLSSLGGIADVFGSGLIPFFEIGYILLYLTFLQTIAISFVLIIIPLLAWKYYNYLKQKSTSLKTDNKLKTFLYFSGIGLGYIFLEIIFIQYFVLYLGNIIYSTSLVISIMLLSSGLGSFYSQKLKSKKINIIVVFSFIIIFLIISLSFLMTIIRITITFPLFIKVIVSILIIFPVSFLMGMPFPFGLNNLNNSHKILIPWAWGINAIFSVIGVVLATIISVELGLNLLIILTAVAYFISLLSQIEGRRNAAFLS